MTLSRRDFLKSSAAVGVVATTVSACGGSSSPNVDAVGGRESLPDLALENPFRHGIASGDPTETSVVLWTRITHLDAVGDPVLQDSPVLCEVFADAELSVRILRRELVASGENDYCVKTDIGGLSPYTAYYYRFTALGFESDVGRCQTLPNWDSDTANRFRAAIVSCSNFAHGYFHVYREIAERNDIDLVIHLGDYVYEYGDGEYGDTRPCDPPHEMTSLEDYRRRHAQYKTDPDLAELHRQYTFVNIWDDHETTDNSRKCTANNHTEGAEGNWYERKSFGIQAYFEWLPIRPVADDVVAAGQLFAPSVGKTWRRFSAGSFFDLIMIDTRLWGRDDESDAGAGFTREDVRDYQSADLLCEDTTAHRDILGPDQEQWLHQQLADSTAKWKILGNQLILSHFRTTPAPVATYFNTDAWDGYPTSQERLYDVIQGGAPATAAIDNVVVITGDIHTSWAFEVTPDPDALLGYEPIAVEFVGPSVSSPGLPIPGETANSITLANPHLEYVNLDQRGWVLLDLSPDFCTGEWYHIGGDAVVDSEARPAPSTLARVYRTASTPGENGLALDPADPTGTRTMQTQPSAEYLANRPAMAP